MYLLTLTIIWTVTPWKHIVDLILKNACLWEVLKSLILLTSNVIIMWMPIFATLWRNPVSSRRALDASLRILQRWHLILNKSVVFLSLKRVIDLCLRHLHFVCSRSLSSVIYERLQILILLAVMIQQLYLLIGVLMKTGGWWYCLFGGRLIPLAVGWIRGDHHYLAKLLLHLSPILRCLGRFHFALAAVIPLSSILGCEYISR